MKVLLFGAKGFLGGYFQTLFPQAAMPPTDIADQGAVARILDEVQPDVAINLAGKTGRPNVDWCEEHKLETLRSNLTGPLVLLEEMARRSIYWVHVSSGCIYEGNNGGAGFGEEDPPNFFGSYYARCKAWADQVLKEFPVLMLRLRMPFDGSLQDRNLIIKLRKYKRVLDATNSLTCIDDFLTVAHALIQARKTGLYNVVNTGSISPYELMELYREVVDPSHRFERLALGSLPEVARAGRSNCLLNTEKLSRDGLAMPPVRDAVLRSLQQIRQLQNKEKRPVVEAS